MSNEKNNTKPEPGDVPILIDWRPVDALLEGFCAQLSTRVQQEGREHVAAIEALHRRCLEHDGDVAVEEFFDAVDRMEALVRLERYAVKVRSMTDQELDAEAARGWKQ